MEKFCYGECKKYLSQFNLKSSYSFYEDFKKGFFDSKVPKKPYDFYRAKKRNEWVSWEDFLGFSIEDRKNKYLPFFECRDIVRKFNLSGQKEWGEYHRKNQLYKIGIPSNPNQIYKNTGWVSYSDWLGIDNYKNLKNLNYLSYDECKKLIKDSFPEIKNRSVWTKFDKSKLPTNVPKRPDYIYKKTGDWINWESFLDSNLSPRSKSRMLLNFYDAKEFVQKLNLVDEYEYSIYLVENNISFLPKRPGYCYRKNWKGYLDYLGSDGNRTSIGEKLIKKFLDDNSIKYEREKKFDSCRNINSLPFDFYLPDLNMCIEYDGELHFKSSELFGGSERLQSTKKNDKIKNKWCKENNISLLRINYLKKSKINEILNQKILLDFR